MNLAPLRDALLDSVRAESESRRQHESEAAQAALAVARAEAARLVEEGRLAGERAAARGAAQVRAAAARQVRESRLRAERALVDELRSRAGDAIQELRSDPRYDRLLDRLARQARLQLGPEAELVRDPPGVGGLTARAGSRSVDYTLPALLDRTIEELGAGLEELWR